MSHTPVREALERLVGEGVLVTTPDRHGFAMPRLTTRDLAGLHALQGTLLRGLADGLARRLDSDWEPDPDLPLEAVEQAIAAACTNTTKSMTVGAVRATELRLAVYRVVEPSTLEDWSEGLVRLRTGLAEGGQSAERAINAFTTARALASDALVAAVEDRHATPAEDRFRI